MTAELAEGRPITEWMHVLESIEEAVARRLAETPEPPAPGAEPDAPAKASLQALDEGLARMEGRLAQAERDAADADDVLRGEAEAYQRWTEGMTAARRRLADWAAGAK
jgi:hypothetical protein